MCVSIGLDAARLDVMPTQVLTVTPRLVAGADSIVLPAIHVLGRQAYYRFVRHDSLGIVQPADRVLWQKRRYRPFAYAERAAWQPWMDHAELKVLVTCDDCCHWAFADSTAQRPHRELHVTDSRTSVRRGSFSDRTTIVFPVNRTEVLPELGNNRRELDKIRTTIETVENDTANTLRSLTIKGYASPEGSYENNERLARERTDSIGAYVARNFSLDRRKIHTDYEPEDWEGLTQYISQATLRQLPHRDELLDIARSDMLPDEKEQAMRQRYPREFAYLLQHCMPGLRHTDYHIDYDRREVDYTQGDTFYVARMLQADSLPRAVYKPLRHYRTLAAVKTNLLFDALLAFNGELELPLGSRWSIMGEYWNPWFVWHHNSRAYQLQLYGGELRYWLGRCRERMANMTGWFAGAYYAWAKYDFEWNSSGDQGEVNSVGLTAGYVWPIHQAFNLELSASIGWLHGPRRHYTGQFNDTHLIWDHDASVTYIGPTKLKVSLVWLLPDVFKKKGGRP